MGIQKKCAACGVLHPREVLLQVPTKGLLCPACRASYVPCDHCGALHEPTSLHAVDTADGVKHVCDKCHAGYKTCAYSGQVYHASDMIALTGSRFVAREYESVVGTSFLSGKRDFLSSMYTALDEEGHTIAALDGEATRLSETPSRVTNLADYVGDRFPITTPQKFTCPICRTRVLARTYIPVLVSPNRHRQSPVCATCATRYKLCDCSHTVPLEAPVQPLPRVRSSAYTADVDGVVPASEPVAGPTYTMSDQLCPACTSVMASQLRDRRALRTVFQYSYQPADLKRWRDGDSDRGPLMGLELEVDCGDKIDEASAAVLAAVGRLHVYIKSDGSLHNGFEQVTHPATIAYYMAERDRYEKLCSIPKKYGFTSHDAGTCGLHVHVDRAFLGADRPTIEHGMRRVIYLTERFYPEIFLFSRREADSAQEWSARWLSPVEGALMDVSQLDSLFSAKWGDGNRRKLVNIQKSPTIEFRIFRGTLNVTTFFATLNHVNNIVCAAIAAPLAELDRYTWKDIIEFQHFEELSSYNAKRIGDGWDGKVRTSAGRVRDSADLPAAQEEVEIPVTLAKDAVHTQSGYYYTAANEALLAVWPKIERLVQTSPEVYIDGTKLGPRFQMEPRGAAPIVLQTVEGTRTLVRTDYGENLPYKWLVFGRAFLDALPSEIREFLETHVDRVIDCISIQ